MTEQRHLQAIDPNGQPIPVTLQVHTDNASSVTITARTATDTIGPTTGADLLDCLTSLRRQLEARGTRLCCQAARINVWPSGQLRQFSNGRQGYVLTDTTAPNPDEPFEVVDLLDPAPAHQIASLDEQYQFVRTFHGLPPTPPTPQTPTATPGGAV